MAAVVVTLLVTALGHLVPDPFAGTAIGLTFLMATYWLVLRNGEPGAERKYGLSLGGLLDPEPIALGRLLRSAGLACAWAFGFALLIFPFVLGWLCSLVSRSARLLPESRRARRARSGSGATVGRRPSRGGVLPWVSADRARQSLATTLSHTGCQGRPRAVGHERNFRFRARADRTLPGPPGGVLSCFGVRMVAGQNRWHRRLSHFPRLVQCLCLVPGQRLRSAQ